MKKSFRKHPEDFRQASPLHRVHADAPAMLLVQGTHDTMAPAKGALMFSEALKSISRQAVVLMEFSGAQHAFDILPSLRTRQMIWGVGRFLNGVMAKPPEARP